MSIRVNKALFVAALSLGLSGTTLMTVQPAEAYSRSGFELHLHPGTAVQADSAVSTTLYLNNDRTYAYNLDVRRDLRVGSIDIPPGAVIEGQYEPAPGGLRYVAKQVDINGIDYQLNATSAVLKDVKDPRAIAGGAVAGDAAIGAAGGALLGELFGHHLSIGSLLGGAVAGVATGNITASRIVVIQSGVPITLYGR